MSTFEQRIFTASDGVNIVGDIGGPTDAPGVVLLHGGGQTRHSWSSAMSALVDEGYRVVGYDARGHGDSGWSPTGDYSLSRLAADLETVLGTIEGPLALVGASMGGMTSFYAIGHSPRPIARALVMVDIVLRPSAAGTARIRSFMTANRNGFASLEEAADAVAAYNPNRPRPVDSSGLLRNLRQRQDGRLYWHWDSRLLDTRRSSEPPEADNALVGISANVKLPTLLIRGDRSDVVDDSGVADMLDLVPQTQICQVPGAGHMVAGECNDAFNEGVLNFLRRYHPAH
jgi:pimeloyl-ACP methyl ester carboxylesterase